MRRGKFLIHAIRTDAHATKEENGKLERVDGADPQAYKRGAGQKDECKVEGGGTQSTSEQESGQGSTCALLEASKSTQMSRQSSELIELSYGALDTAMKVGRLV